MKKTVLITGSTDGIGLLAARSYLSSGHKVLLHGRNPEKLCAAKASLADVADEADIETYLADLSDLRQVSSLADEVSRDHNHLDILINNAGIFATRDTHTVDNLDVRFAVNTIAPYLLTRRLLPLLTENGRVVNLSSAAQAPVDPQEIGVVGQLTDNAAYAKSKLAITMWSRYLADELGADGPVVVAVNPKSFLGSKMVKEAYGVEGNDMQLGADILVKAGLSDEFADATGKYFDNDIEQFSSPHPDAMNKEKNARVVEAIEGIISR